MTLSHILLRAVVEVNPLQLKVDDCLLRRIGNPRLSNREDDIIRHVLSHFQNLEKLDVLYRIDAFLGREWIRRTKRQKRLHLLESGRTELARLEGTGG